MADADKTIILEQKMRNPQNNEWLTTLYVTADKQLHLHGYLETENAVAEKNIQNGAITEQKIKVGAVTGGYDSNHKGNIAEKTITEYNLADGCVKENHIKDKAISSRTIGDNQITTRTLYPGAITAEKINTGAVISDKIGTRAVLSGKIQDYQIRPNHFHESVCTRKKISDNNYKITFNFGQNWQV